MPTRTEPIKPPLERWFPLATPRLILREARDEDFNDIHDYAADPEVARFMDWGPNTLADTRKFLDERLVEQQSWPRLNFSLVAEFAAEHRVIGAVRLAVGDPANRSGDMGYSFHRAYWRRGLASEAAAAMARVAFETLGLHRLWATCDKRNLGSRAVLEKVGLRREGELRQNIWGRDGWRDSLVYAMLAEEWAGRGQQ